ncbi:alpha/beta hydrolase family protein [Paenibacillus brevis]|uniref:Alpha/beta hydrolase family protein n=1 Tax=Paenibacillus brevis TaxID=2841508 RepID=A0ABS6FMS9_9BACL|nr:alpha/beta hydrolase family protein [Paenibacillus brevis]MBU5671343.1 alpha/beta hydrolase family protein [Paenibacillus brevis]
MSTLEQFMKGLTDAAPRRSSFHRNTSFEEWRAKLAAGLTVRLGGFPESLGELQPVKLERVSCPGYIRERLEITTCKGMRMAVYLLIPDSPLASPAPAVITVHGHGYGSRDIVGLMADGMERSGPPGLHKDFAVSLVKQGFIVAAPELLGFGDRRLAEDIAGGDATKNSCYRLSTALLLAGHTMAGFRIYETMRVLDYLRTLEEVAPNRIGIMGISGGGLVAGLTAALDERIACAVVSGYAGTFATSILTRHHCLDNYIPGILLEAEMPDLLGLIAPRGLFLESGDTDHLFGPDGARQALDRLKLIYDAAGCSGRVEADFFAGGHEIHGAPAFAWLREQLAGERRHL